jgi:hypothetical protein
MDQQTNKQEPSSTEGGKVSERRYREPTEKDIGKRVQVSDDPGPAYDANWHRRTLRGLRSGSKYKFETDTGSIWKYARIEVQGE